MDILHSTNTEYLYSTHTQLPLLQYAARPGGQSMQQTCCKQHEAIGTSSLCKTPGARGFINNVPDSVPSHWLQESFACLPLQPQSMFFVHRGTRQVEFIGIAAIHSQSPPSATTSAWRRFLRESDIHLHVPPRTMRVQESRNSSARSSRVLTSDIPVGKGRGPQSDRPSRLTEC